MGRDSQKINLRSWDTACPPQKVFVGVDGCSPLGPNYEYSLQRPAIIDDLLEGKYSGKNLIKIFYSIPEVYAPINEIASRVADANWLLKKFSNDEVDWKNKEFNRLFTQPNPLMNFKKFVWRMVTYEILTGAVYQYFNIPRLLSGNYENILSWYVLPTHQLKIDIKEDVDIYSCTQQSDYIKGYSISDNKGGKRVFRPEQVLGISNLDLTCGTVPNKFSPELLAAKPAIKNLLPVYEARNVIYVKRGAMGFLVGRKQDADGTAALTKAEKEEAQREYYGTYGLTHGKHQIGVVSAPVDYVNTSLSIQELQPFEETLADAVAIYKVLRVPRHLVPSKDQSTFANAESDMRAFYTDVIIPRAKSYAEAWTNYLNIPNRYIEPDYSHISFLQENRKEKADVSKIDGDVMKQRFESGVASLNDWIVIIDGVKSSDPLYDKKIFEMNPEELQQVKEVLNFKNGNQQTSGQTANKLPGGSDKGE